MLIPIGGLQRAVVEALRYAETLSDDVRAIYVDVNPAQHRTAAEGLGDVGRARAAGRAAVAVPLADGAAARVHRAGRSGERPNDYVTVILPEFVPARWWQHLLHNQTSLLIKGALLFRPNIVVTSVPFHLAK